MRVSAIVAAGGTGRRVGATVPKQLLQLDGRSILERSVAAFDGHARIGETIVVLPRDLVEAPPRWLLARAPRVKVVAGGARRQDSVANGFDATDRTADVVLVHDAARPFVSAEVITRVIEAAAAHGAAIAAVGASDTVKRVEPAGDGSRVIVATIPRDGVYLAQTPQGFSRRVLADAVALGRSGVEATDEAMLAERAGHRVTIVDGALSNVKITTADDLETASRRAAGPGRIGVGYDLHRLVAGRPLLLGGVDIPSDTGAAGHSDADVVCHAVTDALLGAAGAGDIGAHFPDTDPQWKDASSIALLNRIASLVRSRGLAVVNVDIVVLLERPKLGPYKDRIALGVASALGIDPAAVSVKAKTNEGVDAVGRGEAIAAHAVALLESVR